MGLGVGAQDKYAGPDSPEVQKAAREALGRAKVADIRATILDIVGVARGIEGVLRDLGAKVTGQEVSIDLPADVLFDFDKADLRPDADASLTMVAEIARAYTGPIRIEGHSDSKGDEAYNQALSERRGASVKKWLVAKGITAARIATRGWGESKPAAPNTMPDGRDNPEGRQKNRRVEIVIRKSPGAS